MRTFPHVIEHIPRGNIVSSRCTVRRCRVCGSGTDDQPDQSSTKDGEHMRLTWSARLAAATAIGLAALGIGTTTAAAGTTTATPAGVAVAASCGWTPASNSGAVGTFTADGVNIHTGNDVGCPASGAGYSGQTVDIRCWWNGNGYDWYYITDESTGVTGWAVRTYLTVTRTPASIGPC
jgi:hypothetical protein